MLKNYLKVALKVLGRRKFFTFISLFGISVTLLVLLVATALLDYVFAARTPEIHADRMLGVYRLTMQGPDDTETSQPGYALPRPLRAADGEAAERRADRSRHRGADGGLLSERPQDRVRAAARGRRVLAGARRSISWRGRRSPPRTTPAAASSR